MVSLNLCIEKCSCVNSELLKKILLHKSCSAWNFDGKKYIMMLKLYFVKWPIVSIQHRNNKIHFSRRWFYDHEFLFQKLNRKSMTRKYWQLLRYKKLVSSNKYSFISSDSACQMILRRTIKNNDNEKKWFWKFIPDFAQRDR